MKKIVGVLGVAFCLMLAGCASQKQDTIEKRNTDISKDLTYDHSMELEYAKMFAVDYYQNDYALVTIADDGKYLIVPEGESVPEDMDKEAQPIRNEWNSFSVPPISIKEQKRLKFESEKEKRKECAIKEVFEI